MRRGDARSPLEGSCSSEIERATLDLELRCCFVRRKSSPDEPIEPPIPFRPVSNGEHVPRPTTRRDVRAEALFYRLADARARKLGIDRRTFLQRASAMATALGVVNFVSGCGAPGDEDAGVGDTGLPDGGGFSDGGFELPEDAGLDADAACEALRGDELIFDVQVHHFESTDVDTFIQDVFIDSDTHVACLSGLPGNELDNPERLRSREIVDRLAGSSRLIVHASVFPEQGEAELDAMQRYAEERPVGAWKVFPQGRFRFDDEATGVALVERAVAVGKPVIAAHVGIAGDAASDADGSSPRPMIDVARQFPEATFLAYHSAYEPSRAEGPYDPADPRGIDRLIKAMDDHGLARSGNVYAELGSVWVHVMTDVTQAAHVLGKLLVGVGEDRILYGSDCIWYGSPQPQIEALRTFQIPVEMQETYGYPALTGEIKAKIFGLNAAQLYGVDPAERRCAIGSDDLARLREEKSASRVRAIPTIRGPRTRRQLLELLSRTTQPTA